MAERTLLQRRIWKRAEKAQALANRKFREFGVAIRQGRCGDAVAAFEVAATASGAYTAAMDALMRPEWDRDWRVSIGKLPEQWKRYQAALRRELDGARRQLVDRCAVKR